MEVHVGGIASCPVPHNPFPVFHPKIFHLMPHFRKLFPQLNKYKKESSGFICAKYSWSDVLEQTLALYRNKRERL
mgnify:CR=1 FL=1